ncbi:MAG: YHS domain-containing (seleno)protein [Bryobacteraceae bacterium]
MKFFSGLAILAVQACLCAGQESNPQTGAKLILIPSEPMAEPRFPKGGAKQAAKPDAEQPVRPAILNLRPAGDPIYLEEEPPAETGQWHTYRRPKVDQFSHEAGGVALQGYDVVGYLDDRAEKGVKEFSFDHGGVTWWFASAERRDLFGRDPGRYVPEYGGFCAYAIGKGYPATADPRAYAVTGGKLYLFHDRAVRAVWEQDQRGLTAKADRNWPKVHR